MSNEVPVIVIYASCVVVAAVVLWIVYMMVKSYREERKLTAKLQKFAEEREAKPPSVDLLLIEDPVECFKKRVTLSVELPSFSIQLPRLPVVPSLPMMSMPDLSHIGISAQDVADALRQFRAVHFDGDDDWEHVKSLPWPGQHVSPELIWEAMASRGCTMARFSLNPRSRPSVQLFRRR